MRNIFLSTALICFPCLSAAAQDELNPERPLEDVKPEAVERVPFRDVVVLKNHWVQWKRLSRDSLGVKSTVHGLNGKIREWVELTLGVDALEATVFAEKRFRAKGVEFSVNSRAKRSHPLRKFSLIDADDHTFYRTFSMGDDEARMLVRALKELEKIQDAGEKTHLDSKALRLEFKASCGIWLRVRPSDRSVSLCFEQKMGKSQRIRLRIFPMSKAEQRKLRQTLEKAVRLLDKD